MQRRQRLNSLPPLLQINLARVAVKSSTLQSVRKDLRTNYLSLVPPNQSLKLTETAVDDFARAKLGVTIGRDIPRAEWLRPAAARRRSLAPVR